MKDSGIKKSINFDDVGVPGFKGREQNEFFTRMIIGFYLNVFFTNYAVNIEGVYKQLSGYYDDLKKTKF